MNTMHNQASYEILLMEYAAGTLDLAQSLIVMAHLSLSPQARHIVRDCERLGGAMLDKGCEPVAMNSNSLESVLGRIGREQPAPQRPQRPASLPEDAEIPQCFEEYIVCRPATQLRWRTVHPGIDAFMLPLECRRSRTHMMRMQPGTISPLHRHRGLELTLILDGALMDETGVYEYGALIVSDEEEAHAPKACTRRGGVCITVAPASETPADMLLRLMSPFLRF